jgi:hypothetical protein
MGRWIPKDSNPVGANEHIGRRIFDEPKLFGATDQNPFDGFALSHFEPGEDRELSVDRVGDGCFNPKAMGYLARRAEFAATTTHKPRTFHGWLTAPAAKLVHPRTKARWQIVPSPERGPMVNGVSPEWNDADLTQNRCHAHLPVPEDVDNLFFAFMVRAAFVANKTFFAPGAKSPGLPAIAGPVTLVAPVQVKDSWLTKVVRFFGRKS